MFILDIETTMPATEIRLVGVFDTETTNSWIFTSVRDFREWCLDSLLEDSVVVTWNGARFDIPQLGELGSTHLLKFFEIRNIKHIDGMLLCKLLMPELPSYSLAHVAKEFFPATSEFHKDSVPKDEEGKARFYNETSIEELGAYCIQDLKVTAAVVQYLLKHPTYLHESARWEHPLKVEQAVAGLVQEQVDIGVNFDKQSATNLLYLLTEDRNCVEKRLETDLPFVAIEDSKLHQPPKKQFVMSGKPSVPIIKYCNKYGWDVDKLETGWAAIHRIDGAIRPLPLVKPLETSSQIKPSESKRLKEYLLRRGWKPTIWNRKKDKDGKWVLTTPKMSDPKTKEPCPNLERIGIHWVPELTRWISLRAKIAILSNEDKGTGWINTCVFKPEEDIFTLSSDADSCGTPTSRFKHRGIVNVPRVGSFLGGAMRSLFVAREGYKLVGWDADALEARMEAHYVHPFDAVYAKTLISGDSMLGTDIHTLNWKTLGLASRDDAKTFKYAITYGARANKIASSLGVPVAKAQEWYDAFWATNTGLAQLNVALQLEWESLDKRFLLGLDGRLITTRKAHAILNSKLQGGGAVVMKHSMILADAAIRKRYPREVAHGLIRMHDEEQWEVMEEIADEIGRLGVESVVKAGECLRLNVPLSASYKVGDNWAQTH